MSNKAKYQTWGHPPSSEEKAIELLDALREHCEREKLPLLALVGLVKSNSMARAWSDSQGMNKQLFLQTVHELLKPETN